MGFLTGFKCKIANLILLIFQPVVGGRVPRSGVSPVLAFRAREATNFKVSLAILVSTPYLRSVQVYGGKNTAYSTNGVFWRQTIRYLDIWFANRSLFVFSGKSENSSLHSRRQEGALSQRHIGAAHLCMFPAIFPGMFF